MKCSDTVGTVGAPNETQQDTLPTQAWLNSIADKVDHHVSILDAHEYPINMFTSTSVPSSFRHYLSRIQAHLDFDQSTYMHALVYLNRISPYYGTIVGRMEIHRAFATCLLLAMKFNCDETILFSRFALVTGLRKSELVHLEAETLKRLEYDVFCSQGHIQACNSWLRGTVS